MGSRGSSNIPTMEVRQLFPFFLNACCVCVCFVHSFGLWELAAGWLDGWMDGWMDGWRDGWMDGWMGGWMEGWVDGV